MLRQISQHFCLELQRTIFWCIHNTWFSVILLIPTTSTHDRFPISPANWVGMSCPGRQILATWDGAGACSSTFLGETCNLLKRTKGFLLKSPACLFQNRTCVLHAAIYSSKFLSIALSLIWLSTWNEWSVLTEPTQEFWLSSWKRIFMAEGHYAQSK